MLKGGSIRVADFKQPVAAEVVHVADLVAVRERGMSRHGESGVLLQDIQRMLLHVKALHERIIHHNDILSADAELMGLPEEAVAMLVCRDVVWTVIPVRVDAHVVGDTVVVVAQSLIDAVDVCLLAHPAVGKTEIFP